MANLTISVNDEVLKRARIRALEENCSVNAILNQYLEHYAQTEDLKRQRARALSTLREPIQMHLSTQVLQEFYVAVTRKLERPMPPAQALLAVEQFKLFPVSVVTKHLVTDAIQRSLGSCLSFWDALIVETALSERADLLVTEDLQDGWQIGSMRVWNPFAGLTPH